MSNAAFMFNHPDQFLEWNGSSWVTTNEGKDILKREAFYMASDADVVDESVFDKKVETIYNALVTDWDDIAVNFIGG